MQDAQSWIQVALSSLRQTATTPTSQPCLSFKYADRPSEQLLPHWSLAEESWNEMDGKSRHRITRTDPISGLSLRVEFTIYADFPVVEWVAYFKNTSTQSTPILADIRVLDICQPYKSGLVLHYNRGDFNTPDGYEPLQADISPGFETHISPAGGRPTNAFLPYFNVENTADQEGAIVAIGWPGQWSAGFTATDDYLRMTGGQELTHFTLHAGEEVRTPLAVLLFYKGKRVQGQNLWRRWMVAHNLARFADGQPVQPLAPMCMGGLQNDGQQESMDYLSALGLHYDAWWIDAGWYPCEGVDARPTWTHVSDWRPNPELLPHGFKPISEHAHKHGLKLMVWFEPERVWEGSKLDREHPEWLLRAPPNQPLDDEWFRHNRLLNLGNPDAWAWLIEHVDRMFTEHGIDWYRQDFNMDPLVYWRANDTADRQGITEIRHVEGYLAYWDELCRRHPELLIDSCASGGRRNDLETLRRAVPLLRSDYQSFTGDMSFAAGNQGHTYGLSAWLPFQGQGVFYNTDHYVYNARSYMCASLVMTLAIPREQVDWDLYRRVFDQFRQAQPYFYGDFYPLTPYSLDSKDWMGWQYDRPDLGAGMIQVFRHADSPQASQQLTLCGLVAGAVYRVCDLDTNVVSEVSGEVLMNAGLHVTLDAAPQSGLMFYTRV